MLAVAAANFQTPRYVEMDLSPFKQDVDELIMGFDEGNFKSLSDMKRMWLARKFSFIFAGTSASTSLALFMQSLYANCVGHMVATYSLSHRLGGLYCLYFFYEIQPFKPPFKIYLSLGKLRSLKALVIDAKKEGIRIASTVVRRLIERNVFVYGRVDMSDHDEPERLKIRKLNAMLQMMQEKLFPDGGSELEQLLHMDMGAELDLLGLQKVSAEYAEAKALLLKEVSKSMDIEDIKHIADDAPLIGDHLEKIVEKWDQQKAAFYQETRSKKGNILQEKEYSAEIAPVQKLADESQLEEESFPLNGFMQLLTAGDEEDDVSQELQRVFDTEENPLLTPGDKQEDVSREFEIENIEHLLENEENQEEDSIDISELEKILFED